MRTAPIPNFPAIPGMNPGAWILGGGGGPGGGGGGAGLASAAEQFAAGMNGGLPPIGGGKNAPTCGPGILGGCACPDCGGPGTAAGDPVDPITGRVYTTAALDLVLPGPLPLLIARSYSSAICDVDFDIGFGWTHSFSWAIDERRRTLRLIQPGAAPIAIEIPNIGTPARIPDGILERLASGGYSLKKDGVLRVFNEAFGKRYLLSQMVDMHGNTIRLAYEGARLSHLVDSVGRLVDVRRDASGRICAFELKTTAADGRDVALRTYDYDASGNLVAARDAAGYATTFAYDEEHRMVLRRDAGGLVAHFKYDAFGRCTESYCEHERDAGLDEGLPDRLADGATKAKGFLHVKLNYAEGITEVVTSRATRRIEGNGFHKLDKSVWASGVHTYEYDKAGEILAYTDALGARYGCARGEDGRLLAVTDPHGAKTEYEHDERGFIVEIRDAISGSAKYERDHAGNVRSIQDDLGLVASFEYDERGQILVAELPSGGVTKMGYDALGNRTFVIEPDGTTRRFQYDDFGRIIVATDGHGEETRYAYDERGLLRAVTQPSGPIQSYEYDADGRLSRLIDADGRATSFTWAGIGVISQIERPDGSVVRFRYDREQDLVRIENERQESHRYLRTSEGRIASETTFDGRKIEYRYDAMGRVVRMREGSRTIDYGYDALGRLIERRYANGEKEVIERDQLGRLTAVIRGKMRTAYQYDARGRVVREENFVDTRRSAIEMTYDALGHVRRVAGPCGSMAIERDLAGRPVEIALGDTAPITIVYDPTGQIAEWRLPEGGAITSAFRPDGLKKGVSVAEASAKKSGSAPAWVGEAPLGTTFQRTYTFSKGGILESIGEGKTDSYWEIRRDRNGRPIEKKRVNGSVGKTQEAFAFGPSGELHEVDAPRSYGPGGRLIARGDTRYAYDELGRVIMKREGAGATWRFAWRDDDMLMSIEIGKEKTISFEYDAFCRRIEKRVSVKGRAESVTRYHWNGDSMIYEQRYRANGQNAPLLDEREYAVLPNDIVPFAERHGKDSRFFYHASAPNGVPEALVAANGAILSVTSTTLFGKTHESPDTPARFAGHYADEETGLHYNRYRYYDPELGQYLSPEPIRLEGGLGVYAYAMGMPTEMMDTNGLSPVAISPVKPPIHAPSVLPSFALAAIPRQQWPTMHFSNAMAIAEPLALSAHLIQWQAAGGPRPADPGAPGWKKILLATQENKGMDSISPRPIAPSVPRAPCGNCAPTMPKLAALGPMMPTTNLFADPRPSPQNTGDATRLSPPVSQAYQPTPKATEIDTPIHAQPNK